MISWLPVAFSIKPPPAENSKMQTNVWQTWTFQKHATEKYKRQQIGRVGDFRWFFDSTHRTDTQIPIIFADSIPSDCLLSLFHYYVRAYSRMKLAAGNLWWFFMHINLQIEDEPHNFCVYLSFCTNWNNGIALNMILCLLFFHSNCVLCVLCDSVV